MAARIVTEGLPGYISADLNKFDSSIPAGFLDDLLCFISLRRDYGYTAGLDDAGLLGGNFSQGVSEHLGMLQTNRGDNTHLGLDYVSGIEPASQPDLDYLEIHLFKLKKEKTKSRNYFKSS